MLVLLGCTVWQHQAAVIRQARPGFALQQVSALPLATPYALRPTPYARRLGPPCCNAWATVLFVLYVTGEQPKCARAREAGQHHQVARLADQASACTETTAAPRTVACMPSTLRCLET